MPRVRIDDLGDPRLTLYRQLKTTNLTRGRDEFVVEGEKLLERLVASPFPIVSALTSERHAERVGPKVPADVPLYVVPHELIGTLVGFNFHQGVLACGRRRPWPGLQEIVRKSGDRLTLVICPRIDNPENLGAVVRIGDVFGVAAILVGGRCPDPLSRRVLRVSMGSSLKVPILGIEDLAADAQRLGTEYGVALVAAVVEVDAEPIDRFHRPDRVALVLGCEGTGLEPEWVARCDRRVTIPMRPGAESLNVAVAAGILLFHLTRRATGDGGVC